MKKKCIFEKPRLRPVLQVLRGSTKEFTVSQIFERRDEGQYMDTLPSFLYNAYTSVYSVLLCFALPAAILIRCSSCANKTFISSFGLALPVLSHCKSYQCRLTGLHSMIFIRCLKVMFSSVRARSVSQRPNYQCFVEGTRQTMGHVLRMPEHRLVRRVLLNCVKPTKRDARRRRPKPKCRLRYQNAKG